MPSAAQEALDVLKANGVTRLFGNPGTTELPLLDATISAGMPFHLCLHEGVATGMADGYGRATGTVGVVMVHTSVGTANSLANLINLRSDGVPMVVIAGDKDDRLTGRGCFCEVPDIAGLARQVTKEAWRVTLPEKFPELLYRGLKVAQAPHPGPVFLAVPENYMGADVPADTTGRYAHPVSRVRSRIHPDDLRAVLDELRRAARPLLIAGNEVGAAGAAPMLAAIAERLAVPVVGEEPFTANALNFPNDHPQYHGNFSPSLAVVRDADFVLAVGARLFMEYAYPAKPHFDATVRIAQIGSNMTEFGKLHPSGLALLGAVGAALADLQALLDGTAARDGSLPAARRARALRAGNPTDLPIPGNAAVSRGGSAIGPADLLDELHSALPEDGVVVDESVLSKFMMQQRFPLRGQRLYFGTSGGGLGWGIGAAMGVQLALPKRRVAAFLGDGGALFNIQGLWTAASNRLPVVFVLVNNGGYMAVRRGLREFNQAAVRHDIYPGTHIETPAVNYCQVAEGFGLKSVMVAERAALRDALRWAFSRTGPVLVDVRVRTDDYV